MVFRTWDLNFGAWIFTLAVSKIETWNFLGRDFQDVGSQFWDLDFTQGLHNGLRPWAPTSRNELEKGLHYLWAEFPCKQMTIVLFPMSIVSTIITFFQFMNSFLGNHFRLPSKSMWWCGDVVPLFEKTRWLQDVEHNRKIMFANETKFTLAKDVFKLRVILGVTYNNHC
jgi:hypothetical protein